MTEPLCELTVTEHAGGPLITVTGEVDMSNAGAVEQRIRDSTGTAGTVTLDLRTIAFFDSSALHMLQRLSGDFDRAGGKLTVVVAADSIVDRLLALTHMDTYLHISVLPGEPD